MLRRGRSAAAVTLASMAMAALVSGCGGESGTAETDRSPQERSRSVPRGEEMPALDSVVPSRCPTGLSNCRTTEGRIVYVERVDPDGDGDAHFVVADPQGITAGGITAIDVRKGLRPDPLPGPGDVISAAGPVQTGSYGQSQIHALEMHVAGR